MSIDRMRNMTAKLAVDNNADYVLFIDDDVIIPINTVESLIACDADIAAGWTLIRGYPFNNMFFKWKEDSKTDLENYADPVKVEIDGNILCDAVGFSCCLIKVSLLKAIQQPYFVTGPFNTEDIYFCLKALYTCGKCGLVRDYHGDGKCEFEGLDPRIVVSTNVITQHLLGPEYIDKDTKAAYKLYFETLNPEVIEREKDPSNGIVTAPAIREGELGYEQILKEAIYG